MVVGSNGLKAGALAGVPLVAINVAVSLTMNLSQIGQVIGDAVITLVITALLGLIIAGLKKALFFMRISSANLAMVMGLVAAGLMIYDGRPEVLVGHGVRSAAEQYLGPSMAAIIPPLAAGLFWGMLMGTLYAKMGGERAEAIQQPVHRRVFSRLFTREREAQQQARAGTLQPPRVQQPPMSPQQQIQPRIKAEKDKCASCGAKKGGLFSKKIKFMECKRDGLIYCENCYTRFPRFGGITYACPRCGGALSIVTD